MPHSLQAARQSKTLLLPMVQLPRIPSPTVACYSLYCWGVALQSLASFCSHRHNPFDDLLRLRSPGLRPPGDVSIRRMPYQYSRITEVLGPSTERLNPSLSGGRAMNLHTGSHLLPVVRRTCVLFTHGIQGHKLQPPKVGLQGASVTQQPIVTSREGSRTHSKGVDDGTVKRAQV